MDERGGGKEMLHVPVLIFETDRSDLELIDIVLTQKSIAHVSHLVPLGKRSALPPREYFKEILEHYHPDLLITSWEHIGLVVKAMVKEMNDPRPIEKWVVGGYGLGLLGESKALNWANLIHHKPISLLDFAAEVERCLFRVRTGVIV